MTTQKGVGVGEFYEVEMPVARAPGSELLESAHSHGPPNALAVQVRPSVAGLL